ncbi:MAG: hypothetical protein KGK07_07925 [Chloroflexota bacterium]|nr:hypothetical protein [Chloroflexota bacterium]
MMQVLTKPAAPSRAPRIDAFLADALAAYRAQLALLDDDGDRGALEDAITLLTDYRLCDIDAHAFLALLARMSQGRSPVALLASRPERMAEDLAARWQAYRDAAGAARRAGA